MTMLETGCAICSYCVEGLRDEHDDLCVACTKMPSNEPSGCGYMIIDGIDYVRERMWFCPLEKGDSERQNLIGIAERRWEMRNMNNKISEYIFNALGDVYCNTCRHFDSDNEDCEWCHRKSMMWSISEEAASSIAMKIVDLMQNGEQD